MQEHRNLAPSAFPRRRRPGRLVTAVAILGLATPFGALYGMQRSSAQAAALERIRLAEDLRGRGPEGLAPLTSGLGHADTVVRVAAIRGLGRQEDPEHVPLLLPLFDDPSVTVRLAVIEAVARSLRGWAGPGAAPLHEQDRRLLETVLARLQARGLSEGHASEQGAAARAIGLLPYRDSSQVRQAEAVLLAIARSGPFAPPASSAGSSRADRGALGGQSPAAVPVTHGGPTPAVEHGEGVAYALYMLARQRRALGDLTEASLAWLRGRVTYDAAMRRGVREPDGWLAAPSAEATTRRLAWLALAAAAHPNVAQVRDAVRDPDAQVRRLAVAYLPNVLDSAVRRDALIRARHDPSPLVRLEWVRVYRQTEGIRDCHPLVEALADTNAHVQLAVIDALGAPCPATTNASARLARIIEAGPGGPMPRSRGRVTWHARAHALVSLARIDGDTARPLVRRDARHPVWQVRMYAARAAAMLRDTTTLVTLAGDAVGNVREAALDALVTVAGHAADSLYLAALRSRDYHVVLAAARALAGAPSSADAGPLLDALDRITAERQETSRDPRMAILARLSEMADSARGFSPPQRARIERYLADFDSAIAERAARLLDRLRPDGGRHVATPQRLPVEQNSILEFRRRPATRLRVTMAPASGGGAFTMRLHADAAPSAVARIVALVRRGYYDGLTWHRVVPNFVIQGGSPAMNEYVGDGPFMRDALGVHSHGRGTVGISTRGHDTGDAQWFINVVDNVRLDPDYTVFATVEQGMDVVDGILEGDVMVKVEVMNP